MKKLFDNRAKPKRHPKDVCRDGCPLPWPLPVSQFCGHCQHFRFAGTLDGLHREAELAPWEVERVAS